MCVHSLNEGNLAKIQHTLSTLVDHWSVNVSQKTLAKRDIIALAVAGIVALGSLKLASVLIGGKDKGVRQVTPKVIEKIVEAPSAQVLVALQDLPAGVPIAEDVVGYQKWPLNTVKESYYAKTSEGKVVHSQNDPAKVTGVRPRNLIYRGTPIMNYMLSDQDGTNILSFRLKKNMRALTVPLAPQGTAGNIFTPGDIVDVYVGDFQRENSGVELQQIRILALDHHLSAQSVSFLGSKGPGQLGRSSAQAIQPPRTATLEVKDEWVEAILKASQSKGAILVLRSAGSQADGEPRMEKAAPPPSMTTDKKKTSTAAGFFEPHKDGGMGNVMPSSYATVRILRGNQEQEVFFQGDQRVQPPKGGVPVSMMGASMPSMPSIASSYMPSRRTRP